MAFASPPPAHPAHRTTAHSPTDTPTTPARSICTNFRRGFADCARTVHPPARGRPPETAGNMHMRRLPTATDLVEAALILAGDTAHQGASVDHRTAMGPRESCAAGIFCASGGAAALHWVRGLPARRPVIPIRLNARERYNWDRAGCGVSKIQQAARARARRVHV